MNARLEALLEHLVRTINRGRIRESEQRSRMALQWQPVDRLPIILSCPLPQEPLFQPYPVAETFSDPEKMLTNELVHAFGTSIAHHYLVRDDLPLTVRANFGTVVVASMYGAPVRQVGENPPWIVHTDDHAILLGDVLNQDPHDLARGWAPRVVETMQAYHETLSQVPELRDLIRVVLPDLQGPFDSLELILGSGVYADLVEEEDKVDAALDAISKTQVALAHHLEPWVTDGRDGISHQHAVPLRGRILLRDDSVLMMSPSMYRDQVAPHDDRVLGALGGGGIHSCGNLGGHASVFLELLHIQCLDLGQPEMNDLGAIYALAQERHAPLIRVVVPEEELLSGAVLDRFPTGVVLCHRADSWEEGGRVIDGYIAAAEKRAVRV
jgi:hypothetical protein